MNDASLEIEKSRPTAAPHRTAAFSTIHDKVKHCLEQTTLGLFGLLLPGENHYIHRYWTQSINSETWALTYINHNSPQPRGR